MALKIYGGDRQTQTIKNIKAIFIMTAINSKQRVQYGPIWWSSGSLPD